MRKERACESLISASVNKSAEFTVVMDLWLFSKENLKHGPNTLHNRWRLGLLKDALKAGYEGLANFPSVPECSEVVFS
jgi:hypothetical protein|tara:strand:+ start:139 stop:372 length:234 start_codon:yes stop_codon:yes gene_type:complete